MNAVSTGLEGTVAQAIRSRVLTPENKEGPLENSTRGASLDLHVRVTVRVMV